MTASGASSVLKICGTAVAKPAPNNALGFPIKVDPRANCRKDALPAAEFSTVPMIVTRIRSGVDAGVIASVEPFVKVAKVALVVVAVVVKPFSAWNTTSPGRLTPGPNGASVVQADAHPPTVASPDAKSQ